MLSLFANSPVWSELDEEGQIFKVWLLIESIVVITTVAANILYVIVRSFGREASSVEIDDVNDDTPESKDYNKDYLNSENTQTLISLFN